MSNTEDKITVVMCSPTQKAKITEIGSSLEDMQKAVGGYIEAIYPFDDEVAVICNDEGKFNGMKPCRALYNENGEMSDIVFGQFFIAGLGEENFCSLTPELAEKYAEKFRYPEKYFRVSENCIMAAPIIDEPKGRTI